MRNSVTVLCRRWAGILLLLAGLLAGTGPAVRATETLESEATRHGAVLKEVFRELLPAVQHYVVQVQINDKVIIPGTLIDSGERWVVAKASELQKFLTEADRYQVRLSSKQNANTITAVEWIPATFLGYDKALDLVFLRYEATSGISADRVQHVDRLQPGQWVISLGFQQDLPIGVGVLGATAREIESGQGYVGLNVEESDQGLVVKQVLANSGAAHAGLKRGDLLLKEDETPALKRGWLSKKLAACEPGDWCYLIANRDGELLPINLRIGVSWDNVIDRQALMNRFGSDVSPRRTGFRSVIQHDTLMHPRYCGGPLVNLKGELMGVNIARAGRTDTYAVPVEEILNTIRTLSATE